MPIHNWSQVDANLFHDFHQTWSVAIRTRLNGGLLPRGYAALVEQHAPALVPDGERIAVFTPIRRPAESSRGPPELPGLIAASVWITSATSRPPAVGIRRFSALMMPEVSD